MKIAIFTDTFLPAINGVTKTLGKMKEYMDKKGIEYRFYVPGKEKNMTGNTIELKCFKFFLYPECKIAIPRYKIVEKSLNEFKPDIIHIVTPFSVGLMGLKYAKDNNIPIVSSYHTDFPKYLKYYSLEFMENTIWHFFRWFHSHSYINFCPSEDTKNDMEKHGIKDIELWGRGIDTDHFNPNKKDEAIRKKYCKNDERLLLYVGRISPEKELDVLMDMAKKLNEKNVKYQLVIVGDGPTKKELESRGIANVHFVGYKSGAELQAYYASADVFTFPSSSETYGNVILEAMASGLPVICPNEGGIKENLINAYNGLAFKKGNSNSMAEKIMALIEDNQLRQNIKENAINYTQTKSWDSIYNDLFNKYRMVIEQMGHISKKISA